MKSIRKEIEKIRVKKWIQISKYCFLIGQLSSVYDQKRRLLNFIFHYLTFSEYKGLNEKLLLFLSFVLSETELSKLSAILDLSDLSELSAKHDLTISKSMPIEKFILVILRSPKCDWSDIYWWTSILYQHNERSKLHTTVAIVLIEAVYKNYVP